MSIAKFFRSFISKPSKENEVLSKITSNTVQKVHKSITIVYP